MKNAAIAFFAVIVGVFALSFLVGPRNQSSAIASSAEGSSNSDHVDGARARALVAAGALLVDVRTPAEFDEGHVEGAVNIPVQELATRLSEVPRDKEVVVYCRSGGRSANATDILAEAGYTVHDLGPMSAW